MGSVLLIAILCPCLIVNGVFFFSTSGDELLSDSFRHEELFNGALLEVAGKVSNFLFCRIGFAIEICKILMLSSLHTPMVCEYNMWMKCHVGAFVVPSTDHVGRARLICCYVIRVGLILYSSVTVA